MGLFSPLYLLGAFAVALPIYLHLLQQHKSTPLPFASLMFFEKRTQASIKHRRLKYLLLMALRIALLALLALAFANPYIKRRLSAGDGSQRWLIVVDESFSMRAGTRLEDAKREALALLDKRGASDRAQVAALGANLRLITDSTQDKGELSAAVAGIRGSDTHASYAELTRALRSIAQASPEPLDAHLFSDVQKSALPANFTDLQLPASIRLIVHPVADKPTPNWTILTTSAPAVLWDTKKTRVQATVAGFDTPAARRSITLLANGKAVGTKAVDVPANGRATVEFTGLDLPYGAARCEIKTDGGDAFPQDDRAIFAVERSDPRRVLFVHEARDTRSPLYFRTALGAGAESSFQLEAVTVEQSANLNPANYAFVVLSDVMSVPPSLEDALQKHAGSGGSIWIAAGSNTARKPTIPLFGEAVNEGKYFSRNGQMFAAVGETDATHPSVFRAARWEGVKFYYAVSVKPGNARVIAKLSDSTPLMLEKKVGEGRVLLFTSTFDNLANDFPLLPPFVPFVEQTARYLAGVVDRSAATGVGAFVELRSAKERSVNVDVIDPDGQHPLSLAEASKVQTYQIQREGFFEFRRANGRNELIAANPDRKESDLAPIPKENLDLWTGSGRGNGAASTNGGPAAQEEEEKPKYLWWWVMLLVLAAAAAESVLAARYLGVQREEGS